jgi:hypothetical protein
VTATARAAAAVHFTLSEIFLDGVWPERLFVHNSEPCDRPIPSSRVPMKRGTTKPAGANVFEQQARKDPDINAPF